MTVKCPFCGAEIDTKNDNPEYSKSAVGITYVCHKVLCTNKDKHPSHDNITVVFKQ